MTFRKTVATVALLCTTSLSTPAFPAAETVRIEHEPLRCAALRCGRPKVEGFLPEAVKTTSARVYFRAEGSEFEYYIDMKPSPPRDGKIRYWAVLPVLDDEPDWLVYRIVVTHPQGQSVTTETKVPVLNACREDRLSDEEEKFAENLIVGMTRNQSPMPPTGFLCDGIRNEISLAGEMRPSEACRREQASNRKSPCLAYYPMKRALILVLAGAGTGVATAVVMEDRRPFTRRGGEAPVSSARP